MITKLQVTKIHTLKSILKWTDSYYRGCLLAWYEKKSSLNLTKMQANDLIERMEAETKKQPPITNAQNNQILALWSEKANRNNSFKALSLWLFKYFKVKHSRRLNIKTASKVIAALEKFKHPS